MALNAGAQQLLDRDTELAQLDAAFAAASAGRGALVVIEGMAGIGKTTLLNLACTAGAERGFTVLRASGAELERELAFGVVRQLFEKTVRADTPALDGAATLATTALLEPGTGPRPETVHAALHGIYWLAAELATQRALLLAVDDAHWADAASLRWFAYLRRRLDGLPLLAIVARRKAEPGAPPAMPGHAPEPDGPGLIAPAPLSAAAVRELLEQAFEQPVAGDFVLACAAATGGNPFLLRELVRALRAEGIAPGAGGVAAVAQAGPASIARMVLDRLERLGEEAVAVAEAVATLGSDARLDRVAALAGTTEERVAALADGLAAAAILDAGEPLRFRHPIVRSAVHEQMPPNRRRLAHLRVAERLLGDGLGPERAAAHLLAAPPAGRGWVVETVRSAAGLAAARGAPDEAIALLRRAHDEGDGHVAETLVELSMAEFTVQSPAALAHARAAREAAATPELKAQASLAVARALTPVGRYDEASAAMADVEAQAEHLDVAVRQQLQAEMLVLSVWHRGARGIAAPLAAMEVEGLAGATPAERLLLALRAMQLVSEGDSYVETLAQARRVRGLVDPADLLDEPPTLIAARVLGIAEEFGEAEGLLTSLLDAARTLGAVTSVVATAILRAEVLYRAGRLIDAEADAREGVRLAVEHGAQAYMAGAVATLAEILLDREGPEHAAVILAELPATAAPPGYLGNMLAFAQGRVAAAAGDLDGAAEHLERAGSGRDAWGELNPASCPWRSELALVYDALGRTGDASGLAEEELARARRWATPRAIGIALRHRAMLMHGEARRKGLRESSRVLERSSSPLEHGRTLLLLGAELRRAGQRSAARAVLTTALDRCHRCGADALAERARAELRIAGARPRRARQAGPEALTAAELRVARIAAGGMTNRQIAQALFLTTKTVESHLSHIYPKLGIQSRTELSRALRPEAQVG